MPTETKPPRRPKLTSEVLGYLRPPEIGGLPAVKWLGDMRTWVAWCDAYRKRLGDWYIEHHAVDHDRVVDAADLDDGPIMYDREQCKVCAYLLDQHHAHRL